MKREIRFCDISAINAPYREAIAEASARVVKSGMYISGNEVTDFEEKLSAMTGSPYAVGTGNGYDALKLIFLSLIIKQYLKPGDKVLVPANTCIASVLSVVNSGLTPVPTDIDPETMVVSAETIEKALCPGVKAVMPVHLYGRTAWDKDIKEICIRKNLIVVEDNAQAIGARSTESGILSDSFVTGSLGHAAAFSFYPTKNIGAVGDGGAVTSCIKDITDTVRILGNYGADRRFHNIYEGENSRLDPLQAAILSYKLSDLESVNEKRRNNAGILDEKVKNRTVSLPPYHKDDNSMVWHQYVVRIMDGKRDKLREHLEENGIGTDIHYPVSPFAQPCFNSRFGTEIDTTEASKLAGEILSIPVNQSLDEEDMKYIAGTINTFNL